MQPPLAVAAIFFVPPAEIVCCRGRSGPFKTGASCVVQLSSLAGRASTKVVKNTAVERGRTPEVFGAVRLQLLRDSSAWV